MKIPDSSILLSIFLLVVAVAVLNFARDVPPPAEKSTGDDAKNNSTIDITHTPLNGDKQHAVAKWRSVSYGSDGKEYKVYIDYVSDSMFCSGLELRTN